jgi:predicted  nucleic acid-binding Zn-ribbon protein
MPHYKCNKCDYSTKSRQSITRHLNNKNPCRTQVIELNSPADLDAHIYEDIPENLLLKQIRDLQAENTELKSKGISETNTIDELSDAISVKEAQLDELADTLNDKKSKLKSKKRLLKDKELNLISRENDVNNKISIIKEHLKNINTNKTNVTQTNKPISKPPSFVFA